MKEFVLCAVLGMAAFGVAGYQMGLFEEMPDTAGNEPIQVEKKEPEKRLMFPEDLAPAIYRKPIEGAREFDPKRTTHWLAILDTQGKLHPWQEYLGEDWRAETIKNTEIIMVVYPQKKRRVSHHTYANGAPPVSRYEFELDVFVSEAKTGKVLAVRKFRNVPRALRPREAWELTAIGQSVPFRTVNNWLVAAARDGFRNYGEQQPITTVVD